MSMFDGACLNCRLSYWDCTCEPVDPADVIETRCKTPPHGERIKALAHQYLQTPEGRTEVERWRERYGLEVVRYRGEA